MASFSNINRTILDAIQKIMTDELQTALVGSGDPLALKVIKLYSLQDDPTLKAPYVTISPDQDNSLEIDHEEGQWQPEVGIGAPIHYRHFFRIRCGVPQYTSSELAYANIDLLTSRIIATLIDHYDLSNILAPGMLTSNDYTRRIEGANPQCVKKAYYKITGGERQFFGTGHIFLNYPVAWYTQ